MDETTDKPTVGSTDKMSDIWMADRKAFQTEQQTVYRTVVATAVMMGFQKACSMGCQKDFQSAGKTETT
jgi:hypothetical protein